MRFKEVVGVTGANYILGEFENEGEKIIFQYRYDLKIVEITDSEMVIIDIN